MKPPSKNWEVGYGRPPKHTQFQPNQSGNPAGRPKGSQNTRTIIRSALDQKIVVTTNGEAKRMTKREVAAAQQVDKAARGDTKAFLVVMQMDENDPLGGPGPVGALGADSEIPPSAYDDIVKHFLVELQGGRAS